MLAEQRSRSCTKVPLFTLTGQKMFIWFSMNKTKKILLSNRSIILFPFNYIFVISKTTIAPSKVRYPYVCIRMHALVSIPVNSFLYCEIFLGFLALFFLHEWITMMKCRVQCTSKVTQRRNDRVASFTNHQFSWLSIQFSLENDNYWS